MLFLVKSVFGVFFWYSFLFGVGFFFVLCLLLLVLALVVDEWADG